MPKAVIHTATGEFRDEQGRFLFDLVNQGWREAGMPPSSDPAFSLIDVPAGVFPDPDTQRWDGTRVVARTAQDIAAAQRAARSVVITGTSRQKDILATCALIVRARNIAGWNNMTLSQKVTATLAEAEVWRGIREFLEDNL